MSTTQDNSRPLGYRFAIRVLRPLLVLLTRREWSGAEHLPTDGGWVVVTNHTSHVDPLVFAHFLVDHGYAPRFLGKSEVFAVPFVGSVLRSADQIPVYRETGRAADAYRAAVAAVRAGKCVAIYPDGTLTRDPDLWPMRGKTGAARVALETRCPVVPVATWGPHELLPPYAKRPRLFPRHRMVVRAGPPVDLGDLHDRPVTTEVLTEATDRIVAAVTSLLEDVRGEKAPAVRFDPRRAGLSTKGRPRPVRKAS